MWIKQINKISTGFNERLAEVWRNFLPFWWSNEIPHILDDQTWTPSQAWSNPYILDGRKRNSAVRTKQKRKLAESFGRTLSGGVSGVADKPTSGLLAGTSLNLRTVALREFLGEGVILRGKFRADSPYLLVFQSACNNNPDPEISGLLPYRRKKQRWRYPNPDPPNLSSTWNF